MAKVGIYQNSRRGHVSEYETKKDDKEQKTTDGLNYPDNLTPKNSLYYTYLPTFCYKISFPKRKKIELKIIAREVLEALLQFEIIANIYEHIWPIIHKHFEEDWGLTNFSNLHHVILHFRYVALIAVSMDVRANVSLIWCKCIYSTI